MEQLFYLFPKGSDDICIRSFANLRMQVILRSVSASPVMEEIKCISVYLEHHDYAVVA